MSIVVIGAIAVVVIAAGVTAYFHARLLPGPLAFGSARVTYCAPLNHDSAFATGISLPILHGGTAVVQEVEAIDPQGMSVPEYSVIRVANGTDGVGIGPYPPSDSSQLANWRARVSASGATLTSGQQYEIVPELVPSMTTVSHPSVKAFKIEYSAGGVDYTTVANLGVVVHPGAKC